MDTRGKNITYAQFRLIHTTVQEAVIVSDSISVDRSFLSTYLVKEVVKYFGEVRLRMRKIQAGTAQTIFSNPCIIMALSLQ